MLDPKAQLVLLPQDREVMAVTGMTEAGISPVLFNGDAVLQAKAMPAAGSYRFTATLLINLAIGLLLTGISMLLAPKAQEPEEANYEETKVDGQDVIRKDRFAPKNGFNSVQNVVELGSVVPIVYAKKEEIDGKQYGGIRVNTNMLWSQLLSIGGGQFFRGIFLVSEKAVQLDHTQMALGNNTLASYELSPKADESEWAGRVTYYFKERWPDRQGRFRARASSLPRTLERSTLPIFMRSMATRKFCQAVQPSNQTEFGVFGHVGNNFGYPWRRLHSHYSMAK